MLWLLDRDRVQTGYIAEHSSIVTAERIGEWSSWTGKFPVSAFDALAAAYFVLIDDEEEVYLVERPMLNLKPDEGEDPHCTCEGRSAGALLHTRTVLGAEVFATSRPGAIVSGLMATLTGDRAIDGLAFGTGDTLGSAIDQQAAWDDMGQTVLDVISSAHLGLRTRLDGTTIYLDVYAPSEVAAPIGDKYGNGTGLTICPGDVKNWRNFAYVLGEGEGDARVQVTVDLTGSEERRELYVDARDLQRTVDSVEMSLEAYEALLTQRGIEKLAECRKVEFAEASLTSRRRAGDVVWYDSGSWSASLMVTEAVTTRERGRVTHSGTLGEPPASFAKALRRRL